MIWLSVASSANEHTSAVWQMSAYGDTIAYAEDTSDLYIYIQIGWQHNVLLTGWITEVTCSAQDKRWVLVGC